MKPSTRVKVGWVLFILGIILGVYSLVTYIVDFILVWAGIIRFGMFTYNFMIFLLCVGLLIAPGWNLSQKGSED